MKNTVAFRLRRSIIFRRWCISQRSTMPDDLSIELSYAAVSCSHVQDVGWLLCDVYIYDVTDRFYSRDSEWQYRLYGSTLSNWVVRAWCLFYISLLFFYIHFKWCIVLFIDSNNSNKTKILSIQLSTALYLNWLIWLRTMFFMYVSHRTFVVKIVLNIKSNYLL